MYKKGILTIKPVVAELTRDTDTFGKMDPWVEFIANVEKVKSSPCNGGGKKPTWSDVLTLKVDQSDSQIHIKVWDQDLGSSSDFVAEGWIPLMEAHMKGDHEAWFPLTYQGKPAGKIMICLDFRAV